MSIKDKIAEKLGEEAVETLQKNMSDIVSELEELNKKQKKTNDKLEEIKEEVD